MRNEINIGKGLRAILGLLFVFSLMLLSKSSIAAPEVDIEWDLRGDDLYYVITAVRNSPYGDKFYCGGRFQQGQCFVGLTTYGSINTATAQWLDYQYNLKGYHTPNEIIDSWRQSALPRSGVIRNWLGEVANGRRCIRLYAAADVGAALFGDSCSGTVTPPPVKPPLPPVSCSISGDINLAHGALNQNDLNGNARSVYAQVSCNREATVRITAQANNGGDVVTLRSDGSLKSKLQVNNISGASGATVRSQVRLWRW
ncbi:MrpH family fimbial adhesin [Serratia proteamaculans]